MQNWSWEILQSWDDNEAWERHESEMLKEPVILQQQKGP